METYWSSKFTGSPAIALSGVVAHNIANGKRECLLDKVTVKFTNIPDHVVNHLLKVGEIFLASGSFTIGDRELGKYVEHLNGTLDAIEGKECCNWGLVSCHQARNLRPWILPFWLKTDMDSPKQNLFLAPFKKRLDKKMLQMIKKPIWHHKFFGSFFCQKYPFFHKKMVPECKPEWNREAKEWFETNVPL